MNEDLKEFFSYCRQKEIKFNIYNHFEDGKYYIKLALSKDKCVHTKLFDISKINNGTSIWFLFLTFARNVEFIYNVTEEYEREI